MKIRAYNQTWKNQEKNVNMFKIKIIKGILVKCTFNKYFYHMFYYF